MVRNVHCLSGGMAVLINRVRMVNLHLHVPSVPRRLFAERIEVRRTVQLGRRETGFMVKRAKVGTKDHFVTFPVTHGSAAGPFNNGHIDVVTRFRRGRSTVASIALVRAWGNVHYHY